MTGHQSELNFSGDHSAELQEQSAVSAVAQPSQGVATHGNRRLAIVAIGSLMLAALTTVMLLRLHASPAPVEASIDMSPRPVFPDQQASSPQLFAAPKLSLAHGAEVADSSSPAVAADRAAALAMPLSSPNTRWQLPAAMLHTEFAAAPQEPLKSDALMVDLPSLGVEASQQESMVHAHRHEPHGLTLAAGSIIGCALETAIDSSRAGYVTCVVTDDVVSDDARVVLIERGSHVVGEYHSDARLGDARIGIIWNRLRKSDGTTVDLASAGTDQLGRSGISGAVDNHWFSRIGAAVLLSVIEDGIAVASAPKASGTTLVFGNTAATGATLSQKVLDASINLPPTITVNPGARISILVAKDIDFQSAYANR